MTKLNRALSKATITTTVVTPEMATQLLEHNQINRPLNDRHVRRIANQIAEGKWKFNGDTIKISPDKDVVDGQHRLWAIIEAKVPVETVIVHGIEKEAFSTIDTIRKSRSGSNVLALQGCARWRQVTATALSWFLRWHRGVIEEYRAPQNRVENADVEMAWKENPGILRAVEKVSPLRNICNTGLLAFVYYVTANRNQELAERLVHTLTNPAGIALSDPLFKLRVHLCSAQRSEKTRNAIVEIALFFKALNAAHRNEKISQLSWRHQGKNPEPFPKLKV